ncbi:MAG: DUF268 domain-containing protein [Elusimicrobia bacterium]|nr:DUF268 domain-containing protein [Elusimicrobiota bacterium]
MDPAIKRTLKTFNHCLIPFFDPRRFVAAVAALPWFLRDWARYARTPGAEPIRLRDLYPQLHDKIAATPFDAHYFHMGCWAARRIAAARPERHVDVGGQAIFVGLLSAFVPTTFVDIRPLGADLPDLACEAGSVLELPYGDGTVRSLSCLHVPEHIGLGRYGDPLDPLGTRKAAAELSRVLAPGGDLYFALPVGAPRLCFNAHRVHSPAQVLEMLPGLEPVEFSCVDDGGRYRENADPALVADADYACGLFRFRKPGR